MSYGESPWFALYVVYYVLTWLVPLAMLAVVPVNRRPSSATAWLMLIFLSPVFGLLVFFLVGSPKLPRRRRELQRTMDRVIESEVRAARDRPELSALVDPPLPPGREPLVRLAAALGGLPALAGNAVELLDGYYATFERIVRDIGSARAFVHLEYFALSRSVETEAAFLAMEAAARRGVKVRVLLDDWSSRRYPGFRDMLRRFAAAGIEAHRMLPVRLFSREWSRPDLRNHRKIVVIDGRIGYTGSQNLIRRDYFRSDGIVYDELVVRVEGPVVAELGAAFLTDWYSESGKLLLPEQAPELRVTPAAMGPALCQVLPSGPAFEDENNLKLFVALIYAARSRLVLTCPYFVPDEALLTAVTSAAKRGVEVSLINSAVADQFLVHHAQHSYYDQLLEAGVRIFLYRRPTLLHAKYLSVDDDVCVVGSSNLDMRSFQLDLEVSLICYDAGVVAALRQVELGYRQRSTELDRELWRRRPRWARLAESVARLTAAFQ